MLMLVKQRLCLARTVRYIPIFSCAPSHPDNPRSPCHLDKKADNNYKHNLHDAISARSTRPTTTSSSTPVHHSHSTLSTFSSSRFSHHLSRSTWCTLQFTQCTSSTPPSCLEPQAPCLPPQNKSLHSLLEGNIPPTHSLQSFSTHVMQHRQPCPVEEPACARVFGDYCRVYFMFCIHLWLDQL
jgi:hypothetical protein